MMSQLKKNIKKTVFKTLNNSYINHWISNSNHGSKILFYHGVEEKIINSQIQSIHIEFEILKKQIRYLEQNFHHFT